MTFFLTLVLTGISVGSVYALIATGLNLTFWTTRTLNFGQGSIMMLCSLGFAFLVMSRVSLPLAICLCLLISGLIGVVVERLTVRPALVKTGGRQHGLGGVDAWPRHPDPGPRRQIFRISGGSVPGNPVLGKGQHPDRRGGAVSAIRGRDRDHPGHYVRPGAVVALHAVGPCGARRLGGCRTGPRPGNSRGFHRRSVRSLRPACSPGSRDCWRLRSAGR